MWLVVDNWNFQIFFVYITNYFSSFRQYATNVTKFDRRGYKPRERILTVTAEAVFIVEKMDKNLKTKDYLPFKHVTGLQMTTGIDNFLLIKVSKLFEKSKVCPSFDVKLRTRN